MLSKSSLTHFRSLQRLAQIRNFTSTTTTMASLDINSQVRMNSGYEIPLLGYGVYQTPASECQAVTEHAFKVGYRHVDSAAAYRNEGPCAEAMRASGLPREQIFFTSKIPPRNLGYQSTVDQVNKTLQTTKLEYIDLMLLHAPYGGSKARKDAWKALVEAHEAGKIRSIGVSNYGVHHLDELEQHIKELEQERGGQGKGGVLSVNQVEIHPWLARDDIAKWCKQRGVIVEAYSPLTRGERFDEAALKPITKRTGKTPAQVLIRWSLQKGFVPLPKSVTLKRIEENADVYDFELTAEEMKSLETGEYTPCAWDPTKAGLDQ